MIVLIRSEKRLYEIAFCFSFYGSLVPLLVPVCHYLIIKTVKQITVSQKLSVQLRVTRGCICRKPYVNVTRWFTTVINQPNVKAVIGEIVLCTKMAEFDAKKFAEFSGRAVSFVECHDTFTFSNPKTLC